MSVMLESGKICLREHCPVEDAERLLILLQNNPDRPVDIGGATHLHAAVLQVLLVFRPELTGDPRDSFLQKWVSPVLADLSASPM